MIIGTLILGKGANKLLYPFGSSGKLENQKSNDDNTYEGIGKSISQTMGSDLELDISELEVKLIADEEGKAEGRFQDWAYAASQDLESVSLSCFESDVFFKENSPLKV